MPARSIRDASPTRTPSASDFSLQRVLGPALFVAIMLFYVVSLTPFVDLSSADTTDPSMSRSNVVNQIVFVAITVGLWCYATQLPKGVRIYDNVVPVIMVLGWFLVGALLSDAPSTALKHVILAGLTCVNASIVLLLPRNEAQFSRLMVACCLLALLLSYVGVTFLPHLAIHQASEVREPMNAGLWRGHFAHKNAASSTMVLFVFFGLYAYRLGQKLSGSLVVVLSLIFLFGSGGKSAIVSLPCILLLAFVCDKHRLLRVAIAVGGILLINMVTIGSALSDRFQDLIGALGIDSSFTGRTDIWRIGIDAFLSRPVIGHGFQGFWQSDAMVHSVGVGTSWAGAAFNGHNAYLDIALTTGAPGLVLTLLWLLVFPLFTLERASADANSAPLRRLFIQIWLFGMFSACLESIFFLSGSFLWVLMVMSVFGLYYQGRARVVGGPARPFAGASGAS